MMLMRLLQLVAEGSVHSYATLAGRLDVSTGLLEQMLQDLARMGYVAPVGGACDTSQCHHCPLGGGCATDAQGNVWVLTAKGAQAAGRKE
jgi:DNA-binding IscR family transcriptional regulator